MKLKACDVAVFAIGPVLALLAACGYCHGHGELALCILGCLEIVAAAGIIAFVGLIAFGWLGAVAVRGMRGLAAHAR
jgi:hypothetical protein